MIITVDCTDYDIHELNIECGKGINLTGYDKDKGDPSLNYDILDKYNSINISFSVYLDH